MVIAGDAAHVVVHGRQHRDRRLVDIDACEDARGLGDAGQPLLDDIGAEVLKMQVDVVRVLADAATLTDLEGHRARHHIARGEVLGVRRVALHETLAARVGEVAALAPRTLGDEAAGTVDAGRVELDELHVLQRQAGTQGHAAAVAGAGVRRGAGEIRAAVAARREDHEVGAKAMQRALGEVERHHSAALVTFHDEVDGEVFDEELGFVLQGLLVERVQHRVAGTIGGGAGALRDALAVLGGHAAEGPLVDAAVGRARERHAVVLEFDDGRRGFLAEELDGVLVTEPVRPLDGVVEVVAPIVLAHVAECGRDTALRSDRVAAGREDFRDTGGGEAGLGEAQSRA